MLYAKLLRTFAGAGADTPWSEGYYNHCDPVPVCKVRAGAAVVVLTPVPARDTCLGVSISIYLYTICMCGGCCRGAGDTCPGQGRCSPHLPHTTEGEGGGRLEGGGGEMVGSQETQAQPAHVSLG